jgi:hypothetical protein
MSTHATIKIVVKHRDGFVFDPEATTTCRLLQYADGYEDFVRPHLTTALEEVAAQAIPDEITADTVGATYGALIDQDLRDWQSSLIRQVDQHTMEAQAGRWQYLVEVDVDLSTTPSWRIIGGSDFN